MTTNSADVTKQWRFYRTMAFVVGTVLLILAPLYIWVHAFGNPEPSFYAAAWIAHGCLFPIYVISTFMLAIKLKWPFEKMILIMLAGTVPAMSFVTERRVANEIASRS